MTHFIVGLIPKDEKPQNNPHLYDAGMRTDLKTWNGAHRWAQRYAKHHRNLRKNMVPVLFMYTCSTVDGHTPPVRWSYL